MKPATICTTLTAAMLGAVPSTNAATLSTDASWDILAGYSLSLAGRDLNGTALNGDDLAGRKVTGVAMGAGSIDGIAIDRLELDETRLRAIDADGRRYAHRQLPGARLVATLDDGGTVAVLVDGVHRHPDKRHRDVYRYDLWYPTDAGWEPLCGYEDGAPVPAIPLEGRWRYASGVPGGGDHVDDPAALTFACEGMVLAKCVLAGYKPWRKVLSCEKGAGCTLGDLSDHHQACTRALRGDYFGDGTAHTVDGTTISIYDGHGIRTDSEPWPIEAEWDADGALCVAPSQTGRDPDTPPLDALVAPDCGHAAYFEGPTLLMTEIMP